jgi:apolipoprotein N-acyltransferase
MIVKLLAIKSRWNLALLSGALFVLAFPEIGSLFPLVFIAWIPLLAIEQRIIHEQQPARKLFSPTYIAFFIYNLGTTWWIWNADKGGAVLAIVANSLLMTVAFQIYHLVHKKLGNNWQLVTFVSTWLCFEYLHFHWELSWPWLTLGNVFAVSPSLVQWYSYTGVLGGSLWILLVAVLLFRITTNTSTNKKRLAVVFGTVLFVPLITSLTIYFTKQTSGTTYQTYHVCVIQPNIDPYTEKFSGSDSEQFNKIIALIRSHAQPNTQLIIAPETALYPNYSLDENELARFPYSSYQFDQPIQALLNSFPKSGLLIGAATHAIYETQKSNASKFDEQSGTYSESYNSSVLFSQHQKTQIIHKSKLVLGVEKIPFGSIFPFLEKMAINLGGTSGSLGIEKAPKVFNHDNTIIAPLVCYESIYGGFNAAQGKQGASFIAVITNDGWWGDTPGYLQHFDFSRLRAIENNRWVVRAANTGKSGIIDNKGAVIKTTDWWKATGFSAQIELLKTKTFYQQYGDYIGVIALTITLLLLLIFFLLVLKGKKRSEK